MRLIGATLVVIGLAGGAVAQTCDQDFEFEAPVGHDHGPANIATLQAGLGGAAQGDFDGFMAIAADPYIQHSPDLADGWEPVWDLVTNRAPGFSSTMITWIGPNGFMDNGNFLVMFREVDHGDGKGPQKKFDLLYFDEDGLYAEHWDMAQYLSDAPASEQSQTMPSDVYATAPVNYGAQTEDANRRLAAGFLNLGFNAGQMDLARDLYVQPDAGLFSEGGTQACYDIQHVLVQNDLVFTYSKVTASDGIFAVVDLMRVRDGAILEHWDVRQAVPDDADMPHDNGMF